MAWFAFAVPIPSGKTEAWRTVSSEFMDSRREDFVGHIDEDTWQHWRDAYQSIAKMLQGLLEKSGRN